MSKKYTYNLAPALPSEKEDTNANRMSRWERANKMKMSDLTDKEWVDVVRAILCLTESEAWAYLEYLRASNM